MEKTLVWRKNRYRTTKKSELQTNSVACGRPPPLCPPLRQPFECICCFVCHFNVVYILIWLWRTSTAEHIRSQTLRNVNIRPSRAIRTQKTNFQKYALLPKEQKVKTHVHFTYTHASQIINEYSVVYRWRAIVAVKMPAFIGEWAFYIASTTPHVIPYLFEYVNSLYNSICCWTQFSIVSEHQNDIAPL